MGNAGKGLYSKEQYLYYYINKKDHQRMNELLQKYPDLIDKTITKDTKQTPLMRAAFAPNPQAVQHLIRAGANVNAVSPKGQTALGIAVKKNQFKIVKMLLENGADATYVNKKNLSIIDYAVLPGYYQIACLLYTSMKEKSLKQSFQYEDIAKKNSYRYVNYKVFLQGVKTGLYLDQVPDFLTKPKKQLFDPVPDPRQSWKDWFKRNVDFKEVPLVQRSSLPEELQPQNRKMGKFDIFWYNWTKSGIKQRIKYNPKKGGHREVMSEMGVFEVDQTITKKQLQSQV